MYLDNAGTIVLEVNDDELKKTIMEFMWVKAPGVCKHSEYVEIIIEYEEGKIPYSNDQELKVIVDQQIEWWRLQEAHEVSPEIIELFKKYLIRGKPDAENVL